MAFLDPSVIWVILAVSFVSLGIGFWKKGGIIILIGGVLLMFCGIFTDGLIIEGSNVEFHPIVRIMIGLVGLMFMLVGIARYGPTV